MTDLVTEQAGIVPLDPDDPRTWKNIPCPVDLRPIQDELTKVGGLNAAGKPNFIIVWAQEYRTFDANRSRIHFDEDALPAIHHPNRWACTPEVFSRASAWLDNENKRRSDAYMRLDFADWNRFPDIAEYLAANELKDNYMQLPHDEEGLGRLARLLPDGWMYLNGLHTYEHIGQQCFYILQFFPAEAFGDSGHWQEQRYDKHYFPETDSVEEMLDILGPFPSSGMYEHVAVRVSVPRPYKRKHPIEIGTTIDDEIHGFKMPTFANTVEPLRELLRIRDSLSDDEKDATKRSAKKFKDFKDELPNRLGKWKQRFREMFGDAKPVGKGNPTNISANKAKFD